MPRALACAPKCTCRTCRIRRMDSLSVGIPSPPSIATGKRWSQVNTDLRNDLRSRRPSLPPGGGRDQIGRVAAIRSVGWPPSGWNTWPPWIGIHSRAREADRLVTLRLRMAIGRELEKRGITTPAAIGAALGMPGVEAIRLLIRHQWR